MTTCRPTDRLRRAEPRRPGPPAELDLPTRRHRRLRRLPAACAIVPLRLTVALAPAHARAPSPASIDAAASSAGRPSQNRALDEALQGLLAAGVTGVVAAVDDPIGHHLPDAVPNGQNITVRMLLQHTSGLFNYSTDEAFVAGIIAHPYRPVSPRQLLAAAFAHPPILQPGTGWS